MIKITCLDSHKNTQAENLALQLHSDSTPQYEVVLTEQSIYLQPLDKKRHGKIEVDFITGSAAHRRKFGGGKGQLIAKAVGLKSGVYPSVFDATAGLGGDAFVLATLGCRVTMMERSPLAHVLLRDGLERAQEYAREQDADLFEILERMTLLSGDSIEHLTAENTPIADVLYLDPMFPERSKQAAAKKEMTAFHALIGEDLDEGALLEAALRCAEYRVVVKRPRLAPTVKGPAPSYNLSGKSCRYDIYTLKKIK